MGVKVGLGLGVCVGVEVDVAIGIGVGVSSGSLHSVIVAPISPMVKMIAHTEMKKKAQPLFVVRILCRWGSLFLIQS